MWVNFGEVFENIKNGFVGYVKDFGVILKIVGNFWNFLRGSG